MGKWALGVDIGNVIINHRMVNQDKEIYENGYSKIPATKNVFQSLNKLNQQIFFGNIYLISKCTTWAQAKIGSWLKDNNFYQKAGIDPINVFFCRERQEKARICVENGITHFIDDRLEVLSNLVGKVPYLFLFQPDQIETEAYKIFLKHVIVVNDWDQILDKIIETIK